MKVFVTGAESTGKSALTIQLADHYGVVYIPEFARDYVAALDRPYNMEDLGIIAKKQIAQINKNKGKKLIFFDTGLVITYVWYEYKYGHVPVWLSQALKEMGEGQYLVCEPDLPWEADPLRENPHIRDELHSRYIELISSLGFEWKAVNGSGNKRLARAVGIVDGWLSVSGIK